MKQFHKEYNSDVDELVEEESAEDWAQLFQNKGRIYATSWQNTLPTLDAWRLTVPLGEGGRIVAERNPYYWKVDSDGSQLPYIDRVTYDKPSHGRRYTYPSRAWRKPGGQLLAVLR
jgi:peptide/nickel transport system substrate-binding protein